MSESRGCNSSFYFETFQRPTQKKLIKNVFELQGIKIGSFQAKNFFKFFTE